MFAYHTLESGQANGTAVTTGNSATGGTAFNAVTAGAGAAVTYTSTCPRGVLALRCTTGASAVTSLVTWTTALGGSNATVHFRCVVRRVAGAAGMSFMRLRAAGAQVCRMTFGASGEIQLRQGNNNQVAAGVATMGAGDWWLIRGTITAGATGSATIYIHHNPHSNTVDETLIVPNAAFGTGSIDEANFGIVAALANGEVIVDDMVVNDTGVPGPAKQSVVVQSSATSEDIAGRLGAMLREALSDAVVTDAASRVVAASRTAGSELRASDFAPRVVRQAREAVSDILSMDELVRRVSFLRAAASDQAFTDAVARELRLHRVATSGVGIGSVAIGHAVTTGVPSIGRSRAVLDSGPSASIERRPYGGRPGISPGEGATLI